MDFIRVQNTPYFSWDFNLKSDFGPLKLPCLSRNRPLVKAIINETKTETKNWCCFVLDLKEMKGMNALVGVNHCGTKVFSEIKGQLRPTTSVHQFAGHSTTMYITEWFYFYFYFFAHCPTMTSSVLWMETTNLLGLICHNCDNSYVT